MILLTHMPFWVYYLIIGMIVSMVLVLKYNSWPTWLKLVAFPMMILGWPAGIPVWLGWALIGPSKK